MKKNIPGSIFWLLLLFLFAGIFTCIPFRGEKRLPSPDLLPVIPLPTEAVVGEDSLIISQDLQVVYNDHSLQFTAQNLSEFIGNLDGLSSEFVYDAGPAGDQVAIFLVLDDSAESAGGYHLNVDREVVISAKEPRDIFFGTQTLIQLLFAGHRAGGRIIIPAMDINDSPRFSWRGMHLDVSRHFFGPDFIKKYIDILALHKMNRFHWHLVDDQGWRIEIRKYPKLTSTGAWRVDREDMPWTFWTDPEPGEKPTYGGFYTQEEIRDIVKYAEDRFITIIPEIEMPAHVQSALAAYPQFSCRQEPLPVPPGSVWPITNIYCAGNDSTFIFLEDILTEVMELFPSKYIHIGGDEADKKEWKTCPKCQARIRLENLADEDELQSYFIRRIEKFLNAHDRILIGWDEILEGGLAENATVMSWRGEKGGIHAARTGHDAVMTPWTHCYFDYYQSLDKDIEPYAIGGFTDLRKVYSYEPVPDELNDQETRYILGTQGNIWTEYIHSGSHVEYMALPRMTALSEVQWTDGDLKDEAHFLSRLPHFLDLLTFLNVNYHIHAPQGLLPRMVFLDSLTIELKNPYPFGTIRYTVNGDLPEHENSIIYDDPITITSDTRIHAAVFLDNGRRSPIRSAEIIQEHPHKAVAVSENEMRQGLTYDYYEGMISTLEDFEKLDFRHSGTVNTVDLPKNIAKDHIGLVLEGFIRVPATGVYTFSLASNDGSRFIIGNDLLIDHDGLHSFWERKSQIALEKGFHPIKILYFEYEGAHGLELSVAGPDVSDEKVPENWLFRKKKVES